MIFKRLTSLRVFVFLLLTVFISETVYATGMMAANELQPEHSSSLDIDAAHVQPDEQHQYHKHQTKEHHHSGHDKNTSTDHCTKCGHCIACFTLLPPTKIENLPTQHAAVNNVLYKVSYISHISAQPHKPPISTINS